MIMHVKDASPDSAMHISHIHGLVSALKDAEKEAERLKVAEKAGKQKAKKKG